MNKNQFVTVVNKHIKAISVEIAQTVYVQTRQGGVEKQ